MQKIMELNQNILANGIAAFIENVARIGKEYSGTCARMKLIPKDEYELVEMKTFISNVDNLLEQLRVENEKAKFLLDILQENQAKIEFLEVQNFYYLKSWPHEVKQA